MNSHRTLLRLGLALGLFFLALLARRPFCTGDLFVFDAADYIRADRNDAWTQYTGGDSVSLAVFLKRYRADREFREHPWGLLYQRNDGAALRHFHVPMGFYVPAVIEQAGGSRAIQRWWVAVLSATTVAAIFLMLLELGVGVMGALLCGLFLCWCPVLIVAGTNVSPHALFSLSAVTCLFALCRWLETRRTVWLGLFSAFCGMSIATLELSPILVAASAATVLVGWRLSRRGVECVSLKKALAGFLGSGVLAALLWPGGVLRGGYVMSYGVFVFQGIFRSGLYFQQRSVTSSVFRLGQSWVVGTSIVILLAAAVWAASRNRKSIPLIGFSMLATLLFAQGLANGFRNTTYASHAVFCILMAASIAIQSLALRDGAVERWLGRTALGIVVILTAAFGAGLFRIRPETVAHDPKRIAGAIGELRQHFGPGTTFVANEDPQAFVTYAPGFHFFGAASVTDAAPEPWEKPGAYFLLFDREAGQPPAGVAFCDAGRLREFGFLVSCREL